MIGSDVIFVACEEEESLGVRSIMAVLNENQITTCVEPYENFDRETFLNKILAENPKIVGFSLIFQGMIPDFADLMSYLRQNGVKTHFTMGGHFPSIEPETTLKEIVELDSVTRHEGEKTLLELYHQIERPLMWSNIQGLAYRDNGKIIVNSPRPLIKNLDELPFPKRNDEIRKHRGLGICSILTSRGCQFNCSFCSIRSFFDGAPGQKRRARSPSNVVEEMEILYKRGVRFFKFNDDDLGTKTSSQKQWILDFAQKLESKGLSHKISWRIPCRVDEIDQKLLSILKTVGLDFVYMGIESGYDHGLKIFNKHYTTKDVFRAIKILNEINIDFEYGFMLLDPDSTLESIKQNVDFLEKLCEEGKVAVHFTKVFPYAGTMIEKRLKEERRIKGTTAYPDYGYNDPRIDLMEIFFSKTFNNVFFDKNGLINKFEFYVFDSVMLEKFFPEKYDIQTYSENIRKLTKRFNDSVFETINKALTFFEDKSYKEIVNNWNMIDFLVKQELEVHRHINNELNSLAPCQL